MHATPTFSVQPTTGGFAATATFPHGFAHGRRPVTGPVAADRSGALAGLLAAPALLQALSAIVTPVDWGDVDA